MKTIVLCLPGRVYSGPIMVAICDAVLQLGNIGFRVLISNQYDPSVYHVRNRCLGCNGDRKDQLPFRGESYDFMFWIDSDILFTFNQMAALLSKNVDMVSGLYRNTDGNFVVSSLLESNPNPAGLVPVEWVGLGFSCWRRGVAETVGFPWFRPRLIETEETAIVTTEDITFCHYARLAGIQPFVDPAIIVNHEKLTLI